MRRILTAASVIAAVLACGIATPSSAHAGLPADPPLTAAQLHDLQQVASWHITESTDYEFSGTGNGVFFGGSAQWFASETDSWKTQADVVVSGPAGCVYHSDLSQDCVPVSGSGSIAENDVDSESLTVPVCNKPYDQPPTATETFSVNGNAQFQSNGGEFSIDYSTNPPQAYARIYSADVPGTASLDAVPGTTVNPADCTGAVHSTNDTSDDSFVSFNYPGADTQVQVQGDSFVIHGSYSLSDVEGATAHLLGQRDNGSIPSFPYTGGATTTAEWTATATIPSADVTITKSGPLTAKPGDRLTYTITAANNGPDDALNFSVHDPIPAGTTFVSATPTSGPPALCLHATIGTDSVVCEPNGTGAGRFTLPAGSSVTFEVVLAVGDDVQPGTVIVNTASASSSVPDPDTSNNSATVATTIAGGDTTPPVISVPDSPVSVEATGPTGATVAYSVSATDDTDGPVPVDCSPPSGGTFGLGSTEVDCTASDAAGNVAHASFDVLVRDTTGPDVHVPADITVDATSPKGAVVAYTAFAVDLVDGLVPVVCVPASGSTFPIGATAVGCAAFDSRGNEGQATFKVTVRGAADQLGDLEAYVAQNAAGPGTSLLTKIQAAIAAVNAQNNANACGDLKALINEANAQSGKKLTAGQAATIVGDANRIRAVLGC
jgi:uncharacterized repeat protein (TIGR01451 family)